MAQKFLDNGYEICEINQNPDIVVVNTCTVTNIADRKSRQVLRKVKEEIKKKLPYLITLSYGLSIRYVYADGKSDPLASLKKLGTLVVSLVVVYGIVQAALGVAEAGRGMGNHDSSQMSSGLWRMGGGILMSAVGAVLAYLGLQ